MSFIFKTQMKKFEIFVHHFCSSIESPRNQNFHTSKSTKRHDSSHVIQETWFLHMMKIFNLSFYSQEKYLRLCCKDEQKSYGIGLTWGWVNDVCGRVIIPIRIEITPNNCMLPIFTVFIILLHTRKCHIWNV